MATPQEESKSASHPPYSEMILTAITELGGKEGSSKLAISKQIEVTYGDRLKADHPLELTQTLLNLKESGKLLFIRNNYLKPDSNDQPRRSRGRPPKPKTDVPEGAEPQLPKQRSLPTKAKDPASVSSGRKRGRPSKNLKTNGDSDQAVAAAVPTEPQLPKQHSLPTKAKDPASVSSGRKRGRPSKNLKTNGDSDQAVAVAVPTGLKRGRGRPPKERLSTTEVSVE